MTVRNPSRENLDALTAEFGMSLVEGSRILDAGSANGPYKKHFAHCRYETADISGNVTYKCDLTALPMDDDFFDAIISTQVLEHIKTPDKAIEEMFRVLKPGGKLLLTTPFFYEEHLIPHDYFRFTQFGLNDLFQRAGFMVERHHWLEGFSCATYYFLTTLQKELAKLPADDPIQAVQPDIEKLAGIFLDRDLSTPIYNVGFPKNHVYHCTKPARVPAATRTIDRVIEKRLTYLSPAALNGILRCTDDVEAGKRPGDFCEFGVALGGSAILLASRLSGERRFLGFDVFGMIPPPGDADDAGSHERYNAISSGQSQGIRGDLYYGYRDDLLEFVTDQFRDFGIPVDDARISLVKGLFEETLLARTDVKQIAVSHIDCDWYDPVLLTLRYSAQRMPVGGYIIVDDFNAWGGARRATLDFLKENEDFNIVVARPHAILKRMRSSAPSE